VEIVYQRVAAIDVHRKQITVAVRTPGTRAGQRRQQVRKYATFYSALREMTGWLLAEQVTHVAMEATGVYWRPVFHALAEPDGLEILLCNTYHVKNVPGRKTDASDAVWLAQLCEVGLLRGSFLPPADIAAIRDLVRYRKKLITERGRETQRLHKVLEDGGVKLDSVASDAIGVSGRAMIEAMIAGERDPAALADLAKGLLRKKIPDLTLALAGRFAAHHGLLCQLHLRHIDHLTDMIGTLDTRIDEQISPYAAQRDRLTTIPGIGQRSAQTIIAEIGVDMSRFPSPAHLASWAGLCPGNLNRPANAAAAPPGTAIHTWPPCWSRPPGPPRTPGPDSVPAIDACTAGSARPAAKRPPSRSLTPCWSSSGTCSPTTPPTPTWAPTTTPSAMILTGARPGFCSSFATSATTLNSSHWPHSPPRLTVQFRLSFV
jgi:transposase